MNPSGGRRPIVWSWSNGVFDGPRLCGARMDGAVERCTSAFLQGRRCSSPAVLSIWTKSRSEMVGGCRKDHMRVRSGGVKTCTGERSDHRDSLPPCCLSSLFWQWTSLSSSSLDDRHLQVLPMAFFTVFVVFAESILLCCGDNPTKYSEVASIGIGGSQPPSSAS